MDDLREAFSAIQNKLNDLFNRVNQLEATPVILSGGGGGAPVDAQYLTLAFNAILTSERRLDFSANFTTVDGGAGADFDVDLSNTTVGAGAYGSATQVGTFTVDAKGRLTAAANVAISGVPPSAHNILSAYHGDTLADNVVDGDIIIGNVTPRWSRLAIAIPAANVRNVLGIDNGELRPSWKTALDATNPSAITVGAAANPGTSLVFSHRDHTHATPATWTATAHNILDATYHSDTVTQAVTRGSLIYANATPKWDELNFPGAANYVLTTNATDVLWSTNTLNITGNSTINGSLVGNMTGSGTIATGGFTGTLPKTGTLPVGTGTAGRIAEWVTDVNTLQASTLIKSGAGVLTLSAGGAYTLTIPATGTTVLGTGTNTYVTYWNGTNTVTGDAGFTYVVATNSLTAGDYYTTDGGNFGISGNELLTVNAAGTFAFTGISGVTVEDDDYIGIASDVRVQFDSSSGFLKAILGDAAGADEFQVVDSGAIAVATIDSNGTSYFAGNMAIIVQSAATIALTTAATGCQVVGQRSLGTITAPTQVTAAGFNALIMAGYGYGNTAFRDMAEIVIASDGAITDISSPGTIIFKTTAAGAIATTENGRIVNAGNLLWGTTTVPGGTATKVLIFGDNAGNPAPGANTAGIFAKDVAGTVEMFGVDEAGNVNQLTPHNYSMVNPIPGTLHWAQYQANFYAGIEKTYDMERALLDLQELTGKQYIYTRKIAKRHKPIKSPEWLKRIK